MPFEAIKRNHIGYRIGASHQKARADDATVRKARQMKDDRYTYAQIAEQLGVSMWTVRDWCTYTTRGDCGQTVKENK